MTTMDVTREFRSAKPLHYPGKMSRSSGVAQEIGSYTESVQHRGRRLATLSLSIDRHVSWVCPSYELKPYTYSASVEAFHPLISPNSARIEGFPQIISLGDIADFREHFVETADVLEGFVRTELPDDEQLTAHFYHKEKNSSASWSFYVDRGLPGVNLSVRCLSEVNSLDDVVQKTVPYLVSVFNQLELTKQVPAAVVEKVSGLAYVGNDMVPQCRINRAF